LSEIRFLFVVGARAHRARLADTILHLARAARGRPLGRNLSGIPFRVSCTRWCILPGSGGTWIDSVWPGHLPKTET